MTVKTALMEEYSYRTELHAHALPVSRCSEFEPGPLMDTYAAVGVDSLVLTNHFAPAHVDGKTEEEAVAEFVDCYLQVKAEGEKRGIAVIFAMEIRFRENNNDYLLYGITERDVPDLFYCVASGMGIAEFYTTRKREDFLILQAHPYRNGMELVDSCYLDGVEVFNLHPGHNSRVAIAAKRALQDGLLISGGTDFHHPTHEGGCLMRTKTRMETPADVARALKEKDFLLEVGGSIVLP